MEKLPCAAVGDAGTDTGDSQVGGLNCLVDISGLRLAGWAREYT